MRRDYQSPRRDGRRGRDPVERRARPRRRHEHAALGHEAVERVARLPDRPQGREGVALSQRLAEQAPPKELGRVPRAAPHARRERTPELVRRLRRAPGRHFTGRPAEERLDAPRGLRVDVKAGPEAFGRLAPPDHLRGRRRHADLDARGDHTAERVRRERLRGRHARRIRREQQRVEVARGRIAGAPPRGGGERAPRVADPRLWRDHLPRFAQVDGALEGDAPPRVAPGDDTRDGVGRIFGKNLTTHALGRGGERPEARESAGPRRGEHGAERGLARGVRHRPRCETMSAQDAMADASAVVDHLTRPPRGRVSRVRTLHFLTQVRGGLRR